jgi:hypothetical protein
MPPGPPRLLFLPNAAEFLDALAAHGTTTVEVKTRQGLDVASEL